VRPVARSTRVGAGAADPGGGTRAAFKTSLRADRRRLSAPRLRQADLAAGAGARPSLTGGTNVPVRVKTSMDMRWWAPLVGYHQVGDPDTSPQCDNPQHADGCQFGPGAHPLMPRDNASVQGAVTRSGAATRPRPGPSVQRFGGCFQ